MESMAEQFEQHTTGDDLHTALTAAGAAIAYQSDDDIVYLFPDLSHYSLKFGVLDENDDTHMDYAEQVMADDITRGLRQHLRRR